MLHALALFGVLLLILSIEAESLDRRHVRRVNGLQI